MTTLQTFITEAFTTRPPAGRLLAPSSPPGSHDHTVRVRVAGELDRATAPELTQAIVAASRGREALSSWATHPVLGLDLSRLTFCDLGGIDAFSEARAALATRGFQLCLTRPTRAVLRLLDLAIFYGWLPNDLECAHLPWPMGNASDATRERSNGRRRTERPEFALRGSFPLPSERLVRQRVGNPATVRLASTGDTV